jgi:histidyl-tRNA synthetase
MERSIIRSVKGLKDILPEEMARWEIIEGEARRMAHVYGFSEIRVPMFEVTELFARSIGASTDIVEKEMYTFPDRDGKLLTLRPEATAGVVRAYIEHNLAASPSQQKLFYLGPMFRHERPQAGRLRQFHQFGVESLGSGHPRTDVEVIALLFRFLSRLELPNLTLEVNSLGDAADRPQYKAALVEFLTPHVSRLCENCQRRLLTNPLRVLDCKVPTCKELLKDAPVITDHLSTESRAHFDAVLTGLQTLKIPYSLNPRLVRGLDYYTSTTFEVVSSNLGAQNAVAAGGRYDGLVESLGGPSTPAIGFAVGLERVSLMIPATVVPRTTPLVFVAGFGDEGAMAGFLFLEVLRSKGIRCDTDSRCVTLKSLIRQADRLHALYTLIIGDDEAKKGVLLLRNMETKEQEEIPFADVAQSLASRLKNS